MVEKQQRVALVTGAGRRQGIGAAICTVLADAGFSICFTYWHGYDDQMPWGADQEIPQALIGEIERRGVRGHAVNADLSRPETASWLMDETARALGPISVLVNNAAHSTNAGIEDVTAEELDAHYAVNVRGMALLTQAFVRQWRDDRGGRVINLTSGQSLAPMPEELAYAASKGAVEALTVSLSPALMARGITINAVNPGPTDSGWMDDELRALLGPKFPAGRIGMPLDAARLVGLLASEDAEWITGQVIHSEGGFFRS
jgi:3-oxoacyl-[acyl-carrier protein] reductase